MGHTKTIVCEYEMCDNSSSRKKDETVARLLRNYLIRITIASPKLDALKKVSVELIKGALETRAHEKDLMVKGPVLMPNKTLRITTRKSPCGDGTATFDKFEMLIHKRLIFLSCSVQTARRAVKRIIPTSREHCVDLEATFDTQ